MCDFQLCHNHDFTARCLNNVFLVFKYLFHFREAQPRITWKDMSLLHLFLETENVSVQLFLSEQLRRLFISWSGAFNQKPFSALHFSQAVYVSVPSLIIGESKGSFIQNMKDKGNIRVKGFLKWGIWKAHLPWFALVYCKKLLSKDAFKSFLPRS